MGSPKRNTKLVRNGENYNSLVKILTKTVLVFVLTTIGIVCVLDGNFQLEDSFQRNNKVSLVTRWKRSETAASIGLPFTSFRLRGATNKTGNEFWTSIQPSFQCPVSLVRKVGEVGDAGYWMCGIDTLGQLEKIEDAEGYTQAPCTLYSTGSGENSFFEVEVIALTNCSVRSFEPSADIVDYPLRYFKENVALDGVLIGWKDKDKMKTLKSLMQQNGDADWVDIVKLNVGEEDDLKTLENILDDFAGEETLPVGQLLVRLKVTDWSRDEGKVGLRIVNAFEGLENQGMRLFRNEINEWEKDSIADFSFINGHALKFFLPKKDLKRFRKI